MGAGDAVVDAQSAAYANNGFLGIPLGLLVFGDWSLPFSGVSVILTACVLYALGLIGLEMARAHGHGLGKALLKAAGGGAQSDDDRAGGRGGLLHPGLKPPRG